MARWTRTDKDCNLTIRLTKQEKATIKTATEIYAAENSMPMAFVSMSDYIMALHSRFLKAHPPIHQPDAGLDGFPHPRDH